MESYGDAALICIVVYLAQAGPNMDKPIRRPGSAKHDEFKMYFYSISAGHLLNFPQLLVNSNCVQVVRCSVNVNQSCLSHCVSSFAFHLLVIDS